MKKRILSLALVILMLVSLIPMQAFADNFSGTYQGLDYSFRLGTLTINGTGTIGEIYSAPWFEFKNDVIKLVIGEGITELGENAFYEMFYLESAKLPESLKVIGRNAFWSCGSLSEINFPDGLESIGDAAFYTCAFKEIVLPESVKSIGNEAFRWEKLLEKVSVPKTAKIGDGAFYDCAKLENEDGFIVVNDIIFGCDYYSPANIVIPEGIVGISGYAFTNRKITSVSFPSTLKFIGGPAFSGNSGLTSLVIPDSVEELGDSAFWNCKALTDVTLPKNLKSISNSLFYGCSSLEAIDIPDGVKDIGAYAFGDCSQLKSVVIPDGVKAIGDYAFNECSQLKTVALPESVESIGMAAFLNDRELENISFGKNIKDFGQAALGGCDKLYAKLCDEDGFLIINDMLLNYTGNAEDVVIPDGVKRIIGEAFSGRNGNSVTVPEGVTEIERATFAGAYYNTIKLPESLRAIREYGFDGSGVLGITIPAGVEEIDCRAFNYCNFLIYVEFKGSAPKSFGYNRVNNKFEPESVFEGSSPVIYVSKNDKTWTDSPLYNKEYGTWSNCYLEFGEAGIQAVGRFDDGTAWYVDDSGSLGFINSYTNLSFSEDAPAPWQKYADIITSVYCSEYVATVGSYAFAGLDSLEVVYLPYSVGLVDRMAFDGCSSLMTVVYEGGAEDYKNIEIREGNDAFKNAKLTALRDVPEFTDIYDLIPAFQESILWAVVNGITTGYEDNTFRPNNTCTRGHVVTFLWRAAGSPEPQSLENPFSDVSESSPFYKAILWAAEQGITTGYADGTFRPNAACTRAHVVTFLWRAVGKPAPESEVRLTDLAGLNADFTAAIKWAASMGITTGYSDGTFRPNAVCTRAHVVTFLYRCVG